MAQGDRPALTVEERSERGSRATRRLRREGYVPGVVYGAGGEATAFKVGSRDLRLVLQDASAVIDLKVGGEKPRPVIVKDRQRHPVRDHIIHLDLLQVRLDEKIQTTVPIELDGAEEAPGVEEGGVLEHVTRELRIEALPMSIPEAIHVDVSGLEQAATLHLSEVPVPEGVTFLDDLEETIVATVTIPSEIVEPEVEEETELVGEDGEPIEAPEEGEEAPEGEAPAEGEGGAPAEGGGEGGGEESS